MLGHILQTWKWVAVRAGYCWSAGILETVWYALSISSLSTPPSLVSCVTASGVNEMPLLKSPNEGLLSPYELSTSTHTFSQPVPPCMSANGTLPPANVFQCRGYNELRLSHASSYHDVILIFKSFLNHHILWSNRCSKDKMLNSRGLTTSQIKHFKILCFPVFTEACRHYSASLNSHSCVYWCFIDGELPVQLHYKQESQMAQRKISIILRN